MIITAEIFVPTAQEAEATASTLSAGILSTPTTLQGALRAGFERDGLSVGMVEVEAISVAPQLGETTRMALATSQEGNVGGSGSNGGLSTVMAMVVVGLGSASLACLLGCGLLYVVRCRKRGRSDQQPDARKGIAPIGRGAPLTVFAPSGKDRAIDTMGSTAANNQMHQEELEGAIEMTSGAAQPLPRTNGSLTSAGGELEMLPVQSPMMTLPPLHTSHAAQRLPPPEVSPFPHPLGSPIVSPAVTPRLDTHREPASSSQPVTSPRAKWRDEDNSVYL